MHNLYYPSFAKSILCSDFKLHILKSITAECKPTSVEKHTTFSASFSSSSSWSSNEWTVKKACLSALSLIPGQPAGSPLVLISCKAAFEPLVLRDMRSRRGFWWGLASKEHNSTEDSNLIITTLHQGPIAVMCWGQLQTRLDYRPQDIYAEEDLRMKKPSCLSKYAKYNLLIFSLFVYLNSSMSP